jgi:hypothetical protein
MPADLASADVDPERKPRLPETVTRNLMEKQDYFEPKIGEDEDSFTLEDAEALGWNTNLFHAQKHFPGRGLVEVRSKDSDEGRFGVLQAIYIYELREHQRAQARARELFGRLVREERLQLKALDAGKAAREEAPALELGTKSDPKPGPSDEEWVDIKTAHERESRELCKAIKHAREALRISTELDALSLLELPQVYLDELNETKPLDAARKEEHGASC